MKDVTKTVLAVLPARLLMGAVVTVALAALVLMVAPAYAQVQAQDQTAGQSMAMPDNGASQTEMTVTGRVASIDLSQGTLTLDNGMQFTLAPNFEFTSFPAVGQDVAVTYDTQGGHNVLHMIDVGDTNSHDVGN